VRDELEVLQWLFDFPPVRDFFRFPAGVERIARYGRDVNILSKRGEDPEAIANAWTQMFAGIGPEIASRIMEEGHWQELVPAAPGTQSGRSVVVWSDGYRRVVATPRVRQGQRAGYTFCAQ
jgi:hypothetical protein